MIIIDAETVGFITDTIDFAEENWEGFTSCMLEKGYTQEEVESRMEEVKEKING